MVRGTKPSVPARRSRSDALGQLLDLHERPVRRRLRGNQSSIAEFPSHVDEVLLEFLLPGAEPGVHLLHLGGRDFSASPPGRLRCIHRYLGMTSPCGFRRSTRLTPNDAWADQFLDTPRCLFWKSSPVRRFLTNFGLDASPHAGWRCHRDPRVRQHANRRCRARRLCN